MGTKITIIPMKFICKANILLVVLVGTVFLPSAIKAVCHNCEETLNQWCCRTSWNGRCCEFPLDEAMPSHNKPNNGLNPGGWPRIADPKPKTNTASPPVNVKW